MLTADLDGQDERDKACVERLLQMLVKELEMDKPDTNNICERSNKREVHLVIMRLLSKRITIFIIPIACRNVTSLIYHYFSRRSYVSLEVCHEDFFRQSELCVANHRCDLEQGRYHRLLPDIAAGFTRLLENVSVQQGET